MMTPDSMGPPTISNFLSLRMSSPYFRNQGLFLGLESLDMETKIRRPINIPADLSTGVRARALGTRAPMRRVAIPVLTAADADPATGRARVVAVIVASMIGTSASVKL